MLQKSYQYHRGRNVQVILAFALSCLRKQQIRTYIWAPVSSDL